MASPQPSPLATPHPWNLVAQGYVAENLAVFQAFAREALRLVPAQGEVLDVAAGPGSLTLEAARTARAVQAVGFAPALPDQFRARAAAARVTNAQAPVAHRQDPPVFNA